MQTTLKCIFMIKQVLNGGHLLEVNDTKEKRLGEVHPAHAELRDSLCVRNYTCTCVCVCVLMCMCVLLLSPLSR